MRLDAIEAQINTKGFASVNELSKTFGVSKVTIRRDLQRLENSNRVKRTFGGAVTLQESETVLSIPLDKHISDEIDVLISATPIPSEQRDAFLKSVQKYDIPIVSESVELDEAHVTIALENYQAAYELGQRAGEYVHDRLERVALLDLTHLRGTTQRSAGFLDGLKHTFGALELVVSLNGEGDFDTSYHLTCDALEAHPQLNMIFAVNDTSAAGAHQACIDLNIAPDKMTIVSFGLEGDTMKSLLLENTYCKIGLAMFPEIVAWYCLHSCIQLHGNEALPAHIHPPYAVLFADELQRYYRQDKAGRWHFQWNNAIADFDLADDPSNLDPQAFGALPATVGFIELYFEHEWYQNITQAIQRYCKQLGIELRIIDADQNLRHDISHRAMSIAKQAYACIDDDDVILLSSGIINEYLAREILAHKRTTITVVINSTALLALLGELPQLNLIVLGGILNAQTKTLIGSMAEDHLKRLRVDKCFVAAAGLSFDFGLSHDEAREVTLYQTMLHVTRQTIVLAHSNRIGQDAIAQIAELEAIDTLVTDDGLSASTRIALREQQVEILIAHDLSIESETQRDT